MPGTTICKNCEASFDASYEYCPYCGQKAADNLTFGVLFNNTISNYFSVDARFFRSFVPLMLKPGILARRFVDGKRLSYLHPAQFYLFISVVFFFLFSFTVRRVDQNLNESIAKGFDSEALTDVEEQEKDSMARAVAMKTLRDNKKFTGMSDEDIAAIDSSMVSGNDVLNIDFGFDRKLLDSLIAIGATEEEKLVAMGMNEEAGSFKRNMNAKILKFYERRGGGIFKTIVDTIPITMFLILPLFAFILKLFYWKRATFAYHMVFSFYYFTFLFTTFSVMLIVERWVFEIPGWLHATVYLSFLVYLFIAMHNFYRSSWLGAIIRTAAISAVLLFVIPIVAFGIILAGFWTY